jgi:hypothetical protein
MSRATTLHRAASLVATLVVFLALAGHAREARAQWAVAHRLFGGGATAGLGYDFRKYEFTNGLGDSRFWYPLPSLELRLFLSDLVSLDLNVPVVHIAASNALFDYFSFTSDVFVDFHPNAPSNFELFVAPGFGVSYASHTEGDKTQHAYAFHIPARIGIEMSSARRGFSFFAALRPFFSIVRGANDTSPGGGVFLEIGIMVYAVRYQANRY